MPHSPKQKSAQPEPRTKNASSYCCHAIIPNAHKDAYEEHAFLPMAKTHTLRALGHYSIAWQFGLYHGGYGFAMIFEILRDSFTLF